MTRVLNESVPQPSFSGTLKRFAKSAARGLGLLKSPARFRGSFATYQDAIDAIPKGALAGYDNTEVAEISFDEMCKLELWDYPVLYWLGRLKADNCCIVDVGGHMGTKYRALRNYLELDGAPMNWVVYDVPSVVRAGRERARADGLNALSFVDRVSHVPGGANVLLASGLLQYLDIPFPELLSRLMSLPKHLVLNKVATRDGPTVVTLEHFGLAEVPYQIRNRAEFLASLTGLGYEIVDEWTIAPLSNSIPSHPELGSSTSRGYCMKLRR